jgi:release factor glutamine methyltransferase
MSLPRSPLTRSAIVTRLRAAGCVFAEDEAQLLIEAAGTPDGLAAMVDRRAAGEPIEQVVGWAEFYGLRVVVDPGVFVPRRRTEFLVRLAASLAWQAGKRRPVVVDLCCGTGAVAAALASALPGTEVHAADIDPAAVRCARRNLAAAGGTVYQGDLFAPLPAALHGRVDILAANVPYVPSDEVGSLPREARLYEPLAALDGGGDGLDVLRRVAAEAAGWLAPGGGLLTETSERQAEQAAGIVAGHGLAARVTRNVELNATVVTGIKLRP